VRLSCTVSLVMCLAVLACGGAVSGDSVAPIMLGIPKDELPSPGLCRVWVSGQATAMQPLPRSCDGIEWTAPLGSRVLYRPDDGSREVHVKYMSRATTGLVTGIDAFSIDTLRLIRVIMPYNGGD
jgi:hypothetical protein